MTSYVVLYCCEDKDSASPSRWVEGVWTTLAQAQTHVDKEVLENPLETSEEWWEIQEWTSTTRSATWERSLDTLSW